MYTIISILVFNTNVEINTGYVGERNSGKWEENHIYY